METTPESRSVGVGPLAPPRSRSAGRRIGSRLIEPRSQNGRIESDHARHPNVRDSVVLGQAAELSVAYAKDGCHLGLSQQPIAGHFAEEVHVNSNLGHLFTMTQWRTAPT